VDASQTLSIWSAAGSIIRGDEGSVGIAAADNAIKTHVQALIGDNSADDPSGVLSTGFTAPTAGVTVTDLSVRRRHRVKIGAYGSREPSHPIATPSLTPKPEESSRSRPSLEDRESQGPGFLRQGLRRWPSGLQRMPITAMAQDGAKSGKGSGTPPTPPDSASPSRAALATISSSSIRWPRSRGRALTKAASQTAR